MSRLFNFLSSLRLTIVLLGLALILVFVGTLAQKYIGLYEVQAHYFRGLFVWWRPEGAGWKVPVFPGGWLLGGALLVNLLAAHYKRFHFTAKKSGIFLTHFGLILLLIGQFSTELFQVESTMRLKEGQTKNFTEDSFNNELAIVDVSHPDYDDVVVIPEKLAGATGDFRHEKLPFTVRVKRYFENSAWTIPMDKNPAAINSRDGIGQRLGFAPLSKNILMENVDKPTMLVEIIGDKGPVGEYLVSYWLTRSETLAQLQADTGGFFGSALSEPQTFTFNGHTYEISLRPKHHYKPYEITLLDFTHDVYKGTDTPKNFSSKIHLTDASRQEDRDVLIYMNNPLRYGGETFFQAGYDPNDSTVTVLQVVKNPAAATPYVACSIMALGLIIQFMIHLVGFASRTRASKTAAASAVAGGKDV